MNAINQPPVLGGPSIADSGTGGNEASYSATGQAHDWRNEQFIQRSRFAWTSSTQWFDTSVSAQIRKNYANFRSQHPEGSKYLHPSFQARSRTFRPKTRALGRKIEAAVAVAMFATSDLVTVTPWNKNDPLKAHQAAIKQKLIQYRLDADETWWFLTCIGAAQDCFINGPCFSHQYWKLVQVEDSRYNIYRNEYDDGRTDFDVQKDTKQIVIENRPCVDLIPIERFRFDPACDWRDPARTSPFLIYDYPTYVGDVKVMISQGVADAINDKEFSNSWWWAVANNDYDSIRAAREGTRMDKYDDSKGLPDTHVISVRKHVHKIDGRDWYWETLQDIVMLRSPQLLTDVYPHLKEGQRPFVSGMMIPEAHKVYPASGTQLVQPLQEEINDVSNLRQDTVKMSTFGRWEVRRNSTVDVATLKAGVPQSVIAVDKIGADIGELKQREVPQTAFLETDRLQLDMDDVSGGMSSASMNANKATNQQDATLGSMNLLDGQSGAIRELEMRTFVKTWAEPVLQQVHDMLEVYETDEEILGDVASSADTTPDQVLQALKSKTKLRINIGFNATSPEKRIGRIVLAFKTFFSIFPQAVQDADQFEIQKEIFGAVGFDDGERFFPNPNKTDPKIKALQGKIDQLEQVISSQMVVQRTKQTVAEIGAVSRERVANITAQVQYDIALMVNKIETSHAALAAIDRQLSSQNNDMKAQELQLERTALAASIDQTEKDFAIKLHEAINGKAAPRQPDGKGLNTPVTPGADKSGTLARDDYGKVPFGAG